ncbi:MAG: 30S ribosomal protein S12 methylthiotransferase RimO [Deltaproteobacteria bacterium]|nr:30S ribosomal protein S12 methylthiotransferase RimO [Deltaproteobacteria bacterium]
MQSPKVHIVSLGCPKNLVDSEVMAASLADAGYLLTDRPEEASVIVVNTCAFIGPAKEESIEAILGMAAWKGGGDGPCTHLIVAGCLPQRYGKGLIEALPEVDLFLGVNEAPHIASRLAELRQASGSSRAACRRRSVIGKPTYLMNAGDRRLPSTLLTSAYIKIADGCSNRCSYCVIPAIRGKARSRTVDDVVKEAGALAARGVRELIITAQDTTAYGRDLKGKPTLALLLRKLAEIDGLAWIRLLYTYPAHLTEALFLAMAAEPKLCHYIDIPIQHGDDAILKAMHRRGNAALIRDAIAMARSLVPDIALRTSLIVGFPGETPRRFETLLSLIREIRFDHLGVFTYSQEEGTAAAELPTRISEKEKERRRERVMEEQALISGAINRSLIGTCQEILVEGPSDRDGYSAVGRCRRQAPEIDGITYLKGKKPQPGSIIRGRIIDADDYDLFAEPA